MLNGLRVRFSLMALNSINSTRQSIIATVKQKLTLVQLHELNYMLNEDLETLRIK